MIELAPILLFTYRRLDTLTQTVAALQQNLLASESELFIFSDGYKSSNDKEGVLAVRKFINEIRGFKKVVVIESASNKGLANSIIDGVTQMVNTYGKVIVLEDDLQTSTNFLVFMNEALNYYQTNPSIISISGYNMTVKPKADYPHDVFFALRSASWGWATWKDKWVGIDWDVNDFEAFSSNSKSIKSFNKMGSDMYSMLKKQQEGLNNSWAIRYCYHQFKYNLFSVYPTVSKVRNIGFTEMATHTVQKFHRFEVTLDLSAQKQFNFSGNVVLDKNIIKQFRSLNGLRKRIVFKIKNSVYSYLHKKNV